MVTKHPQLNGSQVQFEKLRHRRNESGRPGQYRVSASGRQSAGVRNIDIFPIRYFSTRDKDHFFRPFHADPTTWPTHPQPPTIRLGGNVADKAGNCSSLETSPADNSMHTSIMRLEMSRWRRLRTFRIFVVCRVQTPSKEHRQISITV